MANDSDSGAIEGGAHESAAPEAEASRVYYLDHALWRRLDSATTLADRADPWLGLQCRMIDGAERGLLTFVDPAGADAVASHTWPAGGGAGALLPAAVEMALARRQGVIHRPGGHGRRSVAAKTALAYPFDVGGGVRAVVAVELGDLAGADPREAMRQLQWGSAWLSAGGGEAPTEDVRATEAADRLSALFRLVATALELESFDGSASASGAAGAATSSPFRTACSSTSG